MNYLNLLKEFRSIGCDNAAMCSAACNLFIDLVDVRKLSCINYHYNEDLKLIYLTASKMKKDQTPIECSSHHIDTDIYIPAMAFNDINLNTIETIQSTLCNDKCQPNIILAIVDSNSTILYYRMSNGLLDLNNLLTS